MPSHTLLLKPTFSHSCIHRSRTRWRKLAADLLLLRTKSESSLDRQAKPRTNFEIIEDVKAHTQRSASAMDRVMVETNEGLKTVHVAGEVFHNIRTSSERVSEQIQEVSAASEQIEFAAQEVTASIENFAKFSEQASFQAEEVAAVRKSNWHRWRRSQRLQYR